MRARTKPKDLAYKLTQIGSTVNPGLICVHPKASWSVPGKVVAEILFASFLWIHVPDGYWFRIVTGDGLIHWPQQQIRGTYAQKKRGRRWNNQWRTTGKRLSWGTGTNLTDWTSVWGQAGCLPKKPLVFSPLSPLLASQIKRSIETGCIEIGGLSTLQTMKQSLSSKFSILADLVHSDRQLE